MPKDSADFALGRLDHFRIAKGGSPTAQVRTEMQKTMQKHCAVFRDTALLDEGKSLLAKTYGRMQDIQVTDRGLIWNSDLVETLATGTGSREQPLVVMITTALVTRVSTLEGAVDILLMGVSMAVAAVPEGLPAILSLVLAIGVQALARRNAVM